MLIVIGFIVALLLQVLRGFVLSQFWGWFVLPFGVPPLTLTHATGLVLLAALLRGNNSAEKPVKSWSDLAGVAVSSVLFSLLIWGFGAIVAAVA